MMTEREKQAGDKSIGTICALIAAGLGALGVWSWAAGVSHLLIFTVGGRPIAPSTAVSIVLISVATLLRRRFPHHPGVTRLGQALVALVAIFGTFAFLRPWLGWESPLEEWLTNGVGGGGGLRIGKMSSLPGGMLVLAAAGYGAQYLFLPSWSRRWPIASAPAILVSLMGVMVVASYVLDNGWFYGDSAYPMALWTAISFIFLGGALRYERLDFQPPLGAEAGHRSGLFQGASAVSVLIAALLAMSVSAMTALYLRHARAEDRQDAQEMLEAVSSLKLAQITNWRKERLNDADFFARAEFVSQDVERLLDKPGSREAQVRLTRWLDLLKGDKRYSCVAIFDTNAVLQLSLPEQTAINPTIPLPLLTEVLRSNQVVMSDLHLSGDEGRVYIDFLLPVFASRADPTVVSRATGPIAVVLLRLDPYQFLYPMLRTWPTSSRTAETLLCRREGEDVVFLNELRHVTNTALRARFSIASATNLPAARAVAGQLGQMEGRDYRGVTVLADVRRVPDSPWFLVAKVDQDEVFAHLREEARMALALTAVLALAAGLMVQFVSKRKETERAVQELAVARQQNALAQRVAHLMKNANNAILLADAQDNILEANDRAQELYGYSLVEFQSLQLPALRTVDTRAEFSRHAEHLKANGPAIFESWHQRKDGSIFPVEISSSLIEIDGVQYKLGFLRDITQRKAHEREIERLTRFYATLSQVNQTIVRVQSAAELFAEVCRIAVEYGGFKIAWIGGQARGTSAVEVIAQAGDHDGYLEKIQVSVADCPEGRGPVGTCIRQSKTCILNDFINDEQALAWREAATAHHLRAAASLPIYTDHKVCGAFTVYSDEPGVFQEKEIALLEEMALDISYALKRIQQEEQRIQAQAALHESETKLRTLVENIPQKIFVKDRNSRYLFINANYARDLGIPSEKAFGTTDQDYFPKELADQYQVADRRIFETGITEQLEEKYIQGGTEVWIQTVKTPLRDQDGVIVGLCGIFHDITERRHNEEALRISEARLRYLTDSLPNCMLYQLQSWPDGRRRFVYVSETVRRLHGCSPAEALADPARIYAGVPPEDRERLAKEEQQVVAQLSVFNTELRLRNADGTVRWSQIVSSPRKMEDGSLLWDGIEIDITDRKQAEATREVFLTLGARLGAARNPKEAARIIYDTADIFWKWDAATLDICAPGRSEMHSILCLDVVDGVRGEVPPNVPSSEPTPRIRRIMTNGSELILRKTAGELWPDSSQFGDRSRLSASIMCVPVRTQGRPVGVLSIQSYAPAAFSKADLQTLQALADNCGGALERLQAETALREREEQMRLYAEHSPVAVAMFDRDMKYLVVSRRWREDFRLGDQPLVGSSHDEVFPELPRQWIAVHRRSLAGAVEKCDEDPFLRTDGTTSWLHWEIRPWRQADDSIGGIIIFAEDITARKLAVTAMAESEERHRILFESSREAIMVFECSQHNFVKANPAAIRLFGATSEEAFCKLAPTDISPVYQPDGCLSSDKVGAMIKTALQRGSHGFEWVHRRNSGAEFPAFVSLTCMEMGGQTMLLAAVQDITERKQVEQALRQRLELQDQLTQVAATVPGTIYSYRLKPDGSMSFPYASPALVEIFGLTPESVQADAAPALAKIHPADLEAVKTSIAESAATMTPWRTEFRVRGPGGDIWVEGHAVPQAESDGSVLWRGFIHDVTERKRAEEQLRKLSRAVEQSTVSIVITNPQGEIEYVNPRFCELTGYTMEEVQGKNSNILKGGGTSADEYSRLWRTITAGGEWHGEFHNKKKNGELFWEAVTISGIVNSGGTITHFLAVKEDITERKQLESQLRQAQKMEAIGQLAGGVAHDFNNILAATMMHLGLLQERDDLDAELREGLQELMSHSQRAAVLTRQLLMFSRRSVMQMQTLDVNESVENLLKMLRRLIGEQINLDWRGHSQLPRVAADAGMVEQVIMNLVVNARDAMPKGGRIILSTDAVELTLADVRRFPDSRPGRFVSLSVNDTGCGMSENVLARLFEPFFTTKEAGKGTGLGLATVYGIVKQHKGWITVESHLGKGSTFRVFLPEFEGACAASVKAAPAKPLQRGTETILFVEDDLGVRKSICTLLRRLGYTVIEASNGPEAWGQWQLYRDKIRLLYTDMVMPEGTSGLELAEKLRAAQPNLPVIVSSGYSAELIHNERLAALRIHYLPKPCPTGEIADLLRRCLDKPTG